MELPREAYRGFVVQADPVEREGRWAPRAIIETHEERGVSYQEVADDPFVTYETREEAEALSLAFGKAVIDSQLASR